MNTERYQAHVHAEERPYAATAAKSLQSCLTVRPHRQQATRLPCPWDSPGKNTGVGCHFLLQCMKVKSESEVAQSCPTPSDPMDCSLPGSSVHGCQGFGNYLSTFFFHDFDHFRYFIGMQSYKIFLSYSYRFCELCAFPVTITLLYIYILRTVMKINTYL